MINKVIYAPNMHQGGGRALLIPVLNVLKGCDDVLFILDERLVLPSVWPELTHVKRVAASLRGRFQAELQLQQWVKKDVHMLCMASLPSLLFYPKNMTLLIHNRYLVGEEYLNTLKLKVRVRLAVERMWLRIRLSKVHHIVVQTPSMQCLVAHYLQRDSVVFPFADVAMLGSDMVEKKYDFLYVASGEAHKNHRTLVEAWVILAQKGTFPTLCLTLKESLFPELVMWVKEKVQQYHLHICCVGELSQQGVQQLYRQSRSLIYPSKLESFGLPLLEAVSVGLPVLAADLAYVHDVIQPSALFDAGSASSIANAVQHFKGEPAKMVHDIADAAAFLKHVFESS